MTSSASQPERPASARTRWPLIVGLLVLVLLGWFGYRALTPAQHAPQATFVLLSGERVST